MAKRKRRFGRLMLKFALPLVKQLARSVLDKHKDEIIRKLNTKVNLPRLNERDEAKLLTALYEVIVSILDKV